jgi:hypothetical protein
MTSNVLSPEATLAYRRLLAPSNADVPVLVPSYAYVSTSYPSFSSSSIRTAVVNNRCDASSVAF